MAFVCNFPLITIILSLFSGVLCTILKARAARRWTLFVELVLFGLCFSVVVYTYSSGLSFTYPMGEFPAPWGNEIRGGVLEAVMACTFLAVLFCGVLGGKTFTNFDIEESKQNLFFALINLMTAALMSLTWTNDIFTGYVFLEIMTLSACGLIAAREIGRTTLAAVRYMIMNLLGSGLFLLGVIMLYSLTGHLLMVPMQAAVSEIASGAGYVPLTFALAVMTIGIGIKSGMFPFYFWMPDAYGNATPTAAVILSSLVSKAYIFLLIKIYLRAVGESVFSQLPLKTVLLVLGILGMAGGSISAIRSKNINRMVAYSSASQIGYVFMGIGIGGTLGFAAALFQILVHAVTKSLLFLTTPRLAHVSGDSLLFDNLEGSGIREKGAGLCFTIAGLSMIGVPFLAGFASKLLFAVAAVRSENLTVLILVTASLGLSSVLSAVYFIRTIVCIYKQGRGGADLSSYDEYDIEHHVETESLPELNEGAPSVRFADIILILINLALGMTAQITIGVIIRGLEMFG